MVILFFVLVFLGILPGLRNKGQAETLTFWGTDPSEVWAPTITSFSKLHPGVSINYVQVNSGNYETSLVNALAAGHKKHYSAVDNHQSCQRNHDIKHIVNDSLDKIINIPPAAVLNSDAVNHSDNRTLLNDLSESVRHYCENRLSNDVCAWPTALLMLICPPVTDFIMLSKMF